MSIGKIIKLQRITDPRGNLTVAESLKNIPINIKRSYWLYDVPAGESRGGHAHKKIKEILIAVSGSFQVILDNGKEKESYLLNHPNEALLIDTCIWRTLDKFSSGAVCVVLASDLYEEEDYIYDYNTFLEYIKCSR